ncbi:glycosyltransferase family 2 protein [Limibacillus sp. MBR-115]|uniref:glycosyltransferase family 2 protein n=1 Tax=Limibacillus sp. MBR-115 TaxID=3156465 RepID=UPI003397247B
MTQELDVIVVNWFAGPLLTQCLTSLKRASSGGVSLSRVIIVDHGSEDGPLDRAVNAEAALQLPLTVLTDHSNPGYGAGANKGARAGSADYLLFLNPDVYLTAQNLTAALDVLRQDSDHRCGIVGIALKDGKGDITRSCARFPTPGGLLAEALGLPKLWPSRFKSLFMTEWEHSENREVDHVMGAFWLMRRADFERLGGFDETFFMYLEDVDFSYRARAAGLASRFIATTSAQHIGGGTTRRLSQGHRLAFWLDARLTYARKHFNLAGRAVTWAALFLAEPPARLVWALRKGSADRLISVFEGYWIFFASNRGRDVPAPDKIGTS